MLHDAKNNPIDASQARVMLGMVPFFTLRQWIPISIQTESLNYGSIINKIKASAPKIEITLDLYAGAITVCEKRLELSPSLVRLYAWALWVRKYGLFQDGAFDFVAPEVLQTFVTFCHEAMPNLIHGKSEFYQTVKDFLATDGHVDSVLPGFRTCCSRLKDRLQSVKHGVGDRLSENQIEQLLITRTTVNRRAHYGLTELNNRCIRILNEKESIKRLASGLQRH